MTEETTRVPAFQIGVMQFGQDVHAILLPPDGALPPQPERVTLATVNAKVHESEDVQKAFRLLVEATAGALVKATTPPEVAATMESEQHPWNPEGAPTK